MTEQRIDEGLVERLEATIHHINGHWWNRRQRFFAAKERTRAAQEDHNVKG